jgi:predicted MPP superfamily phosphohydrolase
MGTQIIFVGDFVDRGPEQRDVLHIAKRMCEAGEAFAVMGNHEFNALGWAESDGNGDFLRLHTPKKPGAASRISGPDRRGFRGTPGST